MKKVLISLFVAFLAGSCSTSVQPMEQSACLFETVQSDGGMVSFRVVEFSALTDCRQYQALCNRHAENCTECCDVCYGH